MKLLMAECIFCKIANKEISSYLIWENDRFFAFLDRNPVNPGHILIVPKEHIEYIFDMEEPLYSEIFQIKNLSMPLRKATNAKRIGIAIEGFGVNHLHLHLIPVNSGNELDPNRAQKASDDDLAQMANAIKKFLYL
jgi:histidine triad (HIT) family protein